MFYVLFHLILTITSRGRHYNYSHLHKEAEAQRVYVIAWSHSYWIAELGHSDSRATHSHAASHQLNTCKASWGTSENWSWTHSMAQGFPNLWCIRMSQGDDLKCMLQGPTPREPDSGSSDSGRGCSKDRICCLFLFLWLTVPPVYLWKQHRRTPAPCREQPRVHTSSVLTSSDRGLYSGALVGVWAPLGAWAGVRAVDTATAVVWAFFINIYIYY